MQYTFSKSHRAKLSDFKTVFTFLVHAVDTKLELLINFVRVAPGPFWIRITQSRFRFTTDFPHINALLRLEKKN